MPEKYPLFVYGTLCGGQAMSEILETHPRTTAQTRGTLFRMPAGYPALSLTGEQIIYGELIEHINPTQFSVLDFYEGVHSQLYSREIIDVQVGLKPVRAWAYVMERPKQKGGIRIPSGKWIPS